MELIQLTSRTRLPSSASSKKWKDSSNAKSCRRNCRAKSCGTTRSGGIGYDSGERPHRWFYRDSVSENLQIISFATVLGSARPGWVTVRFPQIPQLSSPEGA